MTSASGLPFRSTSLSGCTSAGDFSLYRFGAAAHYFLQAHLVAVELSYFWSDNKMSVPEMLTCLLQCTRVIVILTRSLLSIYFYFKFLFLGIYFYFKFSVYTATGNTISPIHKQ